MENTSTTPAAPASLSTLISNIEHSHHDYTRNALNHIASMLDTIEKTGHTLSAELAQCLHEMEADLLPHLLKEERILFPYIVALEQNPQSPPAACFGSLANPIRMMEAEHAALKTILGRLRALTLNYAPVPDADIGRLYTVLAELDADLLQHIHWEDDILFPRALQFESTRQC